MESTFSMADSGLFERRQFPTKIKHVIGCIIYFFIWKNKLLKIYVWFFIIVFVKNLFNVYLHCQLLFRLVNFVILGILIMSDFVAFTMFSKLNWTANIERHFMNLVFNHHFTGINRAYSDNILAILQTKWRLRDIHTEWDE
jgi:hypothetical protein